MEIADRPQPPTGAARLLFRAPVHLYRWGLGPLLGGRFLLLNHVGRTSGLRRRTVLEVVDRTDGGAPIVCSGFGSRADWYRNVLAHPRVLVQVGARRFTAEAEPLGADEGAEFLARYARGHPRTAVRLARMMGFVVDGSQEDFRAAGRELPFVRLRPRA
ncbi:nitroreductase family deazaflavin-dependent oxidoreductase [Streptomonospora wellingtoniae]|uniref:Nitroreductase family deazaflavin-dependent oxidoreductase n=1 Tax=Streptomonospora wellingtoniae TaxID=3075544 RepID=A0ABU2KTF2_9ACTN|nr:nitroreductase family deazaflavin-dependent oxidoreductase [Streptomonospora sp. DSM 45055]MDT0302560.1 nitroreductase family deazaflavin-dependent oxidoreductase [Streptomonospora sp. DSM 45055]